MGNQVWQDKLDKATVLSELARNCWATRDYARAQTYLLEALAILESQFGQEHVPLVRVLHSLGLLARVRVQYEESEKYYKRALQICEKILGPQELATATRLNYLAGLYNAQGEFEKAEELLLRSLQIYRSKLGDKSQQAALLLMALAILCKRQSKEEDAFKYRQEMLEIHIELDKRKHSDVKVALSKLADFYFSRDELDEADLVFRYGLILGEEQEFPHHPFVAESLLGLARLYADYQAWNESIDLYKRAMASWEKLSGVESSEVQSAARECAQILKRIDRSDEADRILQRVTR